MALSLTTEEAALIAKYREATRPEYYSEAAGKKVPISLDMEAFIITASQDTRATVLNQVREVNKTLSSDSNGSKEYNELLTECLNLEEGNALNQRKEADAQLGSYDEFRAKYFEGSIDEPDSTPSALSRPVRYGPVGEVGQALNDLSLTMDQLASVRDRAQHLWALTKRLQELQRVNGLSDAQRNQIKSWAEPFGKYTNGNE